MTDHTPADFLDDPVLPTDDPRTVKTFREMLDEAVITARSGDTDYAHVLLDAVMGHLGRRINEAWNEGHRAGRGEKEGQA